MISFRDRWAEARSALMLLTRLPVGKFDAPPPPVTSCLWAFPLVGLVVGGTGALVGVAAHASGLPSAMAAILAIGTQIGLTGGLHEDGLADTADGLGGGRDREHALSILRDSRLGTYGTLALILSVLLRSAGIDAVVAHGSAFVILPVLSAASRTVMGLALVLLPPARSDGLGFQAVDGTPRRISSGSCVFGGLLLLCLGIGPGLAVLLAMVLAASAIAWQARQKIGGQTGDILGAIQQCCEAAGLLMVTSYKVVWFSIF